MSGSRGAQNFGVRLALDGAEAVESGLRRVQASAAQAGQAVEQAGESSGRALAVIERGTSVASAGLQKLGGDFAALAPIVDSAGGAVGRLVTALGSGAGLTGVLGAVGAAVGAAVMLWQNWGTVVETTTGRFAGARSALDLVTGSTNAYRSATEALTTALNDNATAERNRAAARGQQLSGQVQAGIDETGSELARVQEELGALRNRRGVVEQLEAYRAIHGPDAVPEDQNTGSRDVRQYLALLERERGLQMAIRRLRDARQVALTPDTGRAGVGEDGPGDLDAARRAYDAGMPVPPVPPEDGGGGRGGGGGGGGRAGQRVNEAQRDRDALIQRNMTAQERYAQGMGRLADLQDRLRQQDPNSVLPDDVVQREAVRLMEEYERATRNAGDATRDVAEGTREWARAAQGVAKALSGAFEDLVFEGKDFNDVLKDLERNLIRIGNQTLLQPLFQQGFNALFGGAGGQGGGAGSGGGAAGLVASLAGSLFGGGGGGAALATTKGAVDALQAAGTFVTVMHDGGIVGAGGRPGPLYSAAMFADAPRFHSGGIIGPDERPIIAQVGERVLNRKEAAEYARGGAVTVNINGVKDPNAFRQSQSQITASLARALGRSGRNR